MAVTTITGVGVMGTGAIGDVRSAEFAISRACLMRTTLPASPTLAEPPCPVAPIPRRRPSRPAVRYDVAGLSRLKRAFCSSESES